MTDTERFHRIRIAALEYGSRAAFKRGSPYRYEQARELGLLGKVCGHMRRPNLKWSRDAIEAEATRCATAKEFRDAPGGAYDRAKALGIVDELRAVAGWTRS